MRCCQVISVALIAATLGLAGPSPAAADPLEPKENSLQATVDGFVSYLKSETTEAMVAVARLARDNKDSLAAAKSYLESQYDAWRAPLSGQKERAKTLGKDAAAIWEAWRETAVSSWATI